MIINLSAFMTLSRKINAYVHFIVYNHAMVTSQNARYMPIFTMSEQNKIN